MMRLVAGAAVLVASLGAVHPAMAQDQGARIGNSYIPSTHSKGCSGLMCDDAVRPAVAQDQGARIGNTYIPSTHSKGCSGLMCDGDDPRRAEGPPPPCQGLICGMSPYGMGRPITAAEAQRIQEERARAAAAAPAPVADEPKRSTRRHKSRKAKAKAKAAVASRTPDPASAAPAAR